MFLPAGEAPETKMVKPLAAAVKLAGKRCLIMDDDELVSNLLTQMLTKMGAEAEIAPDGETALEAYCRARESGKPFSVVFADLKVPGGMGGKEMTERLKNRSQSASHRFKRLFQ
jgi:two-component system, cell cycle sensor histidine kinase and response regulator CckA